MSRWLSQVNHFLEKLDDQTQNYVEETIISNQEKSGDVDESDNLDSILAQRGLASASAEDDDHDEALAAMDNEDSGPSAPEGTAATEQSLPPPEPPAEELTPADEAEAPTDDAAEKLRGPQSGQPSSEERDKDSTKLAPAAVEESSEESAKDEKDETKLSSYFAAEDETANKAAATTSKETNDEPQVKKAPPPPPPATTAPPDEATSKVEAKKAPPPPPPPPAKQTSAPLPATAKPVSAPAPVVVKQDPNPALVKEAREAQKEVRTLRRHVVTLNKQLETTEAEVSAQRKELEQVGESIEKERAKAKLERDNERKRHAEELKLVQAQHEKVLSDQKTRMEKQLSDIKQRLLDMEQTRMQEGGNWDKELQGALEREQILMQQNAALEDEKATFLAQISILQSQQEALGDRIESLSQTADSAMEREREADERLDQALSVHAHQISQRQARESELERTIAEMGAAMAALRNKESNRLSDYNTSSEINDTAGENTSQDSSLRMRLDMALHDLEAAHANIDLERQRTEALQRELRDISNERTEEATNARMNQNKHDRQIAELTLQITRLQQQASADVGSEGSSRNDSSMNDAEARDLKNQIKELSEEILKSRNKLGSYSSEISTLKSRLKGAIDRAEKAESAMEEALAVQSTDLERPPSSGNAMRRRGVGRSNSGTTSISSAMHLSQTQRVGKAIDALDSFSVSTGKYLRYNPMARAAFLLYLVLLHLWTFVVIFFHAHNFEDIHRDAADMPHGPDAMMQNQLGAGGQAVAAAVEAAKAAAAAGGKQNAP